MSDKNNNFIPNEDRYVTKGINERLPIEIQIFLWNLIDKLYGQMELDYLQVFELRESKNENTGEVVQIIIHMQEEPEYKTEYEIPMIGTKVISGKIFVIDDINHATMLWADEY